METARLAALALSRAWRRPPRSRASYFHAGRSFPNVWGDTHLHGQHVGRRGQLR
jgi:hypothetical protein